MNSKGTISSHTPIPSMGTWQFIQAWLRGIAQVDFLPNALTGAIFVIALFASGWEYGCYGLGGTLIATLTALVMRVPRDQIGSGLWGFNGCLVGTGLAVFLGAFHLSTLILALFACIAVVVIGAGLGRFLDAWELPGMTAPFCIVVSALTISAPQLTRIWHGGAPAALPTPAASTSVTGLQLIEGFFANVSQIFFMPQWYVGLIFLIGIFVASRWLGLMACVGSVIALFTAWAAGVPGDQIGHGLLGYNAVLVAMALCGVFIRRHGLSFLYAIVGAMTATLLTPAVSTFFGVLDGHTLTWPFVLTTLFFLAAVKAFPELKRT
ncbi:urea transporter [Devriesea agamarum]|uniref:urea transporter n=1 Tax=Devriesea agamarum TaxID=472569 RepID=UPI000AC5AAB3|nr:urea transporter [Devriesea agamarum]